MRAAEYRPAIASRRRCWTALAFALIAVRGEASATAPGTKQDRALASGQGQAPAPGRLRSRVRLSFAVLRRACETRTVRSRLRSLVVPCALSAFAGMAVVGGLSLALSKKPSPYHKLNLFTRVLSYVENNYVENVDQDELIYGALRGMLETLD